MAKKQSRKKSHRVHDELKGFDISINEFGEIVSNLEIERLNQFLNEKVDDKKLRKKRNQEEEE